MEKSELNPVGVIVAKEFPPKVFAFMWNNQIVLSGMKPAGESVEYRKVGRGEVEVGNNVREAYQNGYKEGLNKALEISSEQIQLAIASRPIIIQGKVGEGEDCVGEDFEIIEEK